jgi:hypothetical protein
MDRPMEFLTYSESAGFRLSFAVAAVFIGIALAMMLALPVRPRAEEPIHERKTA